MGCFGKKDVNTEFKRLTVRLLRMKIHTLMNIHTNT